MVLAICFYYRNKKERYMSQKKVRSLNKTVAVGHAAISLYIYIYIFYLLPEFNLNLHFVFLFTT